MHDRIDIDGSIQTTNGAFSPAIRGNNNTTTIYNAPTADANTTPVEYLRPRKSWINARSAQLVAWIASVIGGLISATTVFLPLPLWEVDLSSVQTGLLESLPRFLLVALAVAVVIAGWRFAVRRRRALPKIGRRGSPFRSLIPVDREGLSYERATARARCLFCHDNGRDEWGVIAVRGTGRRRWTGVRCRLGHRFGFRIDSLFID